MITPSQIREKRISTVSTDGYDRNEVNELLVEIIDSYEAVCAENKELYRKMEILANKIEEYREDEDSIKTAIISAQKMARQVTTEAKEKAEQTISESAASAQQTVQDAKEKADKIIGEAREYVANLTKEKTVAADIIMSDAQEKANKVISSAHLVAQDTIDKAKQLTEEIVSKAKSERIHNQEIAAKLKDESREFKTTLVSLYESELAKLRELTSAGNQVNTIEDLESELNDIITGIDSAEPTELAEPSPEQTDEVYKLDEQADEIDELDEQADEIVPDDDESVDEAEADYDEQLQEQTTFEIEEIDDIDEIINEIESIEPDFEPIEEESEPPTEEEIASALNAFTEDEITPVESNGATIPVIEEEPEFENSMPFESFFNVGKTDVNTEETISLTAPDEDDDDDDTSKFRGFFKKRK